MRNEKNFTTYLFSLYLSLAYGQVYNFPVKPGTDAWKALKTHDDMVRVCQIPDNIIKGMSTEDLLKTFLNYPLLYDMYAFNDKLVGFATMSKRSNGFVSFKDRKDAGTTLLKIY